MNEINYITETLTTLEIAVQPETLLDDDDFGKICLRVLRCEKYILDYPDLKGRISTDWEWLECLCEIFYEKMMMQMGEDDEAIE